MNKRNSILAILIAISVLFTISSKSTSALSLDGIVDGVKDMFTDKEDKNVKKKDFTIESDISLAPDGDEKKNNEIDTGDIVQFTFTLVNTTDTGYSYGTLKTNIDSKSISFIHNIHGTTGLVNNEKTIEIPNIRLNKGETITISFDALINYFQTDKLISTEPEFIASNNTSIAKAKKNEINAKKLSEKEVNERGIHVKKQ